MKFEEPSQPSSQLPNFDNKSQKISNYDKTGHLISIKHENHKCFRSALKNFCSHSSTSKFNLAQEKNDLLSSTKTIKFDMLQKFEQDSSRTLNLSFFNNQLKRSTFHTLGQTEDNNQRKKSYSFDHQKDQKVKDQLNNSDQQHTLDPETQWQSCKQNDDDNDWKRMWKNIYVQIKKCTISPSNNFLHDIMSQYVQFGTTLQKLFSYVGYNMRTKNEKIQKLQEDYNLLIKRYNKQNDKINIIKDYLQKMHKELSNLKIQNQKLNYDLNFFKNLKSQLKLTTKLFQDESIHFHFINNFIKEKKPTLTAQDINKQYIKLNSYTYKERLQEIQNNIIEYSHPEKNTKIKQTKVYQKQYIVYECKETYKQIKLLQFQDDQIILRGLDNNQICSFSTKQIISVETSVQNIYLLKINFNKGSSKTKLIIECFQSKNLILCLMQSPYISNSSICKKQKLHIENNKDFVMTSFSFGKNFQKIALAFYKKEGWFQKNQLKIFAIASKCILVSPVPQVIYYGQDILQKTSFSVMSDQYHSLQVKICESKLSCLELKDLQQGQSVTITFHSHFMTKFWKKILRHVLIKELVSSE